MVIHTSFEMGIAAYFASGSYASTTAYNYWVYLIFSLNKTLFLINKEYN